MASMLEQDITFRKMLGQSRILRTLARGLLLPVYYHLVTSGYGAFVEEELTGWLYLRGWRQILYIEAVATHPAWRKQGIGEALMSFAESQAHELHRQWLGLTVTAANEDAVRLYERQGYRRAHWRIAQCDRELSLPAGKDHSVRLQPVFGPGAWQAYRHFTAIDLTAGDGWAAPATTRLLEFEPHRQLGWEWLVMVDNQPVAYLNKHGSCACPTLYLACGSNWWGDPRIVQAIGASLNGDTPTSRSISLRLASSGHHDAALPLLSEIGFVTHPADTFKMFKYLGDAASGASQSGDEAKL